MAMALAGRDESKRENQGILLDKASILSYVFIMYLLVSMDWACFYPRTARNIAKLISVRNMS